MSGIDVTQPLLDIAAERVPGAALVAGDLQDPLPFPHEAFDVVTAFNSVRYADDPVAVVKGMSQVVRPGGLVSFVVWGPPDKCESGVISAELGPLLPPAPPAAPGPPGLPPWLSPGARTAGSRTLAATARLTPQTVSDVASPLIYPDLATAVRTQLSSGPAQKAIRNSGLPAIRGALTRAFAGSRQPDGTYRQDNVFRYLVARV